MTLNGFADQFLRDKVLKRQKRSLQWSQGKGEWGGKQGKLVDGRRDYVLFVSCWSMYKNEKRKDECMQQKNDFDWSKSRIVGMYVRKENETDQACEDLLTTSQWFWLQVDYQQKIWDFLKVG